MLVVFLFMIISKEDVPDYLDSVHNKAIQMSKVKIPKKERSEKAIPGDYSFNNIDFKLKKTLISPKTKDIKGFAIEDKYLALVKRKSFDIDEEFVFIDPTNQKFYQTSEIIYYDENLNIYNTNEVTIFDVMTNFKYHTKTIKEYSPKISINWEEHSQYPILHPIEGTTSKASIGFVGTFSNNMTISFKTMSDIHIRCDFDIDGTVLSDIQLNKGLFEYIKDLPLFDNISIAYEKENMKFNFRGIDIEIKPMIKAKGNIVDNPFGEIEDTLDISKAYHISGSKSIEVTNYITKDTKWNLDISAEHEIGTMTNKSYVPYKAEFRVAPQLTIYYSIDIFFGDVKSTFESGLIIPIQFRFQAEIEKYSLPTLEGAIICRVSMFYKIDEIKITGSSKKEQVLIESQEAETYIKEKSTSNTILVLSTIYNEQVSKTINVDPNPRFLLIERNNIQSRKPSSNIYYQLYMNIRGQDVSTDNALIATPMQPFSTSFFANKSRLLYNKLFCIIDRNILLYIKT